MTQETDNPQEVPSAQNFVMRKGEVVEVPDSQTPEFREWILGARWKDTGLSGTVYGIKAESEVGRAPIPPVFINAFLDCE